jgi:hypothetical protein
MPSHKHLTEIASSGSSTGKSQHKFFAFVVPVYSPQCLQRWKPGGTMTDKAFFLRALGSERYLPKPGSSTAL